MARCAVVRILLVYDGSRGISASASARAARPDPVASPANCRTVPALPI